MQYPLFITNLRLYDGYKEEIQLYALVVECQTWMPVLPCSQTN
jgi:hypothetical protein